SSRANIGKRPLPAIIPYFMGPLFHKPALPAVNEFDQLVNLSRGADLRPDALDRLRSVQPRAGQQPERGLKLLDSLGRKPAPLEAYFVRAEDSRLPLADGGRKWQHVSRYHAVAPNDRISTDAAELMNASEGADVSVVADNHVPSQRDA